MPPIPPDKLRIGRALLAGGPVTQELLQRELDRAQKSQSVLGKALLQSGFPKEEDLVVPLLSGLRIPRINAKNTKIPLETIRLLPEQVAVRQRILPLDQMGQVLVVVTPDVANEDGLAEARQVTGLTVFPIQSDSKTCSNDEFEGIIKDYYRRLAESGMGAAQSPLQAAMGTTTHMAPLGPTGQNGAVRAIPAGNDAQDAFWRRYMSGGPVPVEPAQL